MGVACWGETRADVSLELQLAQEEYSKP